MRRRDGCALPDQHSLAMESGYVRAMTRLALLPLVALLAGCNQGPLPAAAAPGLAKRADACTPRAASGAPLELVVLGSGGPRGAGRAGSSYVVVIDGTPRMLVDTGSGSFVRLGELQLDQDALDTILLTHLHIDHAGDFPDVVKSRDVGSDGPLTFRIFGPAGRGPYPSTSAFVDRMLGEQGAFGYLRGFRNELRTNVTDLPIEASSPIKQLVAEGGTKVSAIAVDHGDTPAVAYRVEHARRSVVITGDLASQNDNLVRLAAQADLLVYDTTVLDPPGSPPVLYELHTTPKRIGEVAASAQVRRLVLSHLPPNIERTGPEVLASVRASYKGPVELAHDCLRLDVSAGAAVK